MREGELLGPGGEGSWDSQGVGTRCVVPWRGRLLMVYEGVEAGTGTSGIVTVVVGAGCESVVADWW